MKRLKKTIFSTVLLVLVVVPNLWSQDSLHLSLSKAVKLGVDSSKQLMLAEAKIKTTVQQYKDIGTNYLPKAKVSLMGSEAFIPTQTFQMDGLMKKPMHLPSHATSYIGTLGIQQLIFGGNQVRFAKKSVKLLQQVQKLQKKHQKEEVMLSVIRAYINLYKIDQNIKIVEKSIKDVEGRIQETKHFKKQGLATLNDVLRFKLQKSKFKIALVNLQNSRRVANYVLVTLLEFPEETILKEDPVVPKGNVKPLNLSALQQKAVKNREDLKVFDIQQKRNSVHLRKIKGSKLPTLGAGVNLYYINPNDRFIPKKHTFLVPITIGLNLSWDISSLWNSKHKEAKVQIQSKKISIAKEAFHDKINIEINKSYHNYLQAIQKVELLKTSVKQAKENDRIMEEKYQNQLATTTDRIDAQTMYYKTLIDLSVAKAEVVAARYKLMASTGTLKSSF